MASGRSDLLRAVALFAGLVGCRARADVVMTTPPPVEPTRDVPTSMLRDGEIELRFASSTSRSKCRVSVGADGTIGTAPDLHPASLTMDAAFDLVPMPSGELGLQLGPLRMILTVDNAVVAAQRIDAEGFETNERGVVERARVADDVAARQAIELLLGAPRHFIRLDERGVPTARRTDLPPELAAISDKMDLWSSWLFAMPVLPRIASKGDCWKGTRSMAISAALQPPPSVELRYCLESFDADLAVITADGVSEGELTHPDRNATSHARWSLHSKATVARVGGRLLDAEQSGHIDMMTTVKLPASLRWASTISCTAAH
ncbi:MAG TPA: hypothetical protein VG755_32910 [Nannocystaceae bacterium]|nr:hypothetical protein [Nannocystaceae bacterium]